jgi:2'-5' RNA ligase
LHDYYDKHKHGDKKFHPHITVASRDLIAELFSSAWEYFSEKEYFRVIKSGTVDVLRHENKAWKTIRSVKI